jgi:hypothetical protein
VQLPGDAFALVLLRAQEVVECQPPFAGQPAHLCGETREEPRGRRDRRTAEDDQEGNPGRTGARGRARRRGGAEEAEEQDDEAGELDLRAPHDLPLGLALCPAHLTQRVRRRPARGIPQSGEPTTGFGRSTRP